MLNSLIVVALVFIILLGWWYRLANANKSFYKTIPGPTPLPIFGNALEIRSTAEMLKFLMKYSKQFNGLFKMQVGPFYKVVVVSDYKYVENILTSTRILSKTREYKFASSWLGDGLAISEGEKWKKHRRIITPAFFFSVLEQFLEVFDLNANILVDKLEKEAGNSSVEIDRYVGLCALDIISESSMGVGVNAQKNPYSAYVRAINNMSRIIIERTFSILQMFSLTYPLTRNYHTEKNALKVIHGQTNNVINKRRNKLREQNKVNDKNNFGAKTKLAFLDLLLQTRSDGKPLTQEEIRDEVGTFMFAGHHTTASAMSFVMFCLANYPQIQAKAFEEQLTLFANQNDPSPSYADLQNMKYLEKVIKETIRLYSTIPFIGRITTEPVELDGKIIPKGVPFYIFIYGVHHNPEYYPEPYKFDPDRFDTIDGKLPFAYIPFGAGSRNCIGQKFAMLKMKSVLSKIIRKFELEPASPQHEVILAMETILKSTNGVKIRLKLRN